MSDKDYCLELLNEINAYNGNENQANRIRQLICYIAESPEITKTLEVQELITEAARLIRVFGYYKLSGINPHSISELDDNTAIKNQLVFNYYRAKSKEAYLDKKQKEIIDTYQGLQFKRIFVSAPTSFGKTHILKEILYLNRKRYDNIVLIFPTVALLTENMDSISEFVKENNLDYVVSTSFQEPTKEEQDDQSTRNIFILTPERAITIFAEKPKIQIDFFFFDEVYKIDEDFNSNDDYDEIVDVDTAKHEIKKYSRAVAFRLVLYFLAKNTPEFYLAGPYINLDTLKPGMLSFIEHFNVTKIMINTEATLKTIYNAWKNNTTTENVIEGSSSIDLQGKFNSSKEKVQTICDCIQKNNWGLTLVYCDNPHHAVERAKCVLQNKAILSGELQEFILHLKRNFSVKLNDGSNSSDKWSLIQLLSGEIGVHHGKLPKYIQKEMLRLFNNEQIKILFCTSTLIEGVNTGAKNIIVSSNCIRKNQELSQFDMKNIIGRAGRYYRHFLGRVFFIDQKQSAILNSAPQQLNFSLFDNVPLSYEDLDNMEIEELAEPKRIEKENRDRSLHRDILPDSVFFLNRLFDRKQQETLLGFIDNNFLAFQNAFIRQDIYALLNEENVKLYLSALQQSGIINENQTKGHFFIIKSFYRNGIFGLIDYEMNYNKNFKNVDTGYSTAFSKAKTVVEYQLPRYFTLIESLYNHLCEQKEKPDKKVDLKRLNRYFETGAQSEAGQYLIEYGMPIGAVRTIENKRSKVKSISLEDGKVLLLEQKQSILKYMDAFEIRMFNKLIG